MTDTVSEKFSEFQLISCAGKKKELNFINFFFLRETFEKYKCSAQLLAGFKSWLDYLLASTLVGLNSCLDICLAQLLVGLKSWLDYVLASTLWPQLMLGYYLAQLLVGLKSLLDYLLASNLWPQLMLGYLFSSTPGWPQVMVGLFISFNFSWPQLMLGYYLAQLLVGLKSWLDYLLAST